MNYLEFCKALELEPCEEHQKVYEEADLLQPLDTSWILPLMPQTGERLLRLAEEVAKDPLKMRYVNFLKACFWSLPEKKMPWLPQGEGKEFENLAPALVLLSCAGAAEAEMERRNIPDDQRQWIRGGHEKALLSRQKAVGYPAMTLGTLCWRKRMVLPNIYMIRDMEFELKVMNGEVTVYREKATGKLVGLREDGQTETEFLCTRILRGGEPGEAVTLSKEAYEAFVRLGDDVMGVHIPRGAKIDPESLAKSCAEARQFFAQYYPDRPPKCFYCGSWLLDPTLANYLKPTSNIITFQRNFQCWPVRSTGKEVFNFIHPQPFNSYEELPENTSLERMLKNRYLADDPIYVHAGLCPFE